MRRRFLKHKILLDEGFYLRTDLPHLNSRFDVKHIAADLKEAGLPDIQVYQLAIKQKRLLVTYNAKDFKKLAPNSKNTGIIAVSPNLLVGQIDKKLTALLIKSKPKDLFGKFTTITGEL